MKCDGCQRTLKRTYRGPGDYFDQVHTLPVVTDEGDTPLHFCDDCWYPFREEKPDEL